jgi:hypothetical protein
MSEAFLGFDVSEVEVKILLCKRASEFSHSLGQFRKFPFRAHGRGYILINELPKGFAETTGAKWQ